MSECKCSSAWIHASSSCAGKFVLPMLRAGFSMDTFVSKVVASAKAMATPTFVREVGVPSVAPQIVGEPASAPLALGAPLVAPKIVGEPCVAPHLVGVPHVALHDAGITLPAKLGVPRVAPINMLECCYQTLEQTILRKRSVVLHKMCEDFISHILHTTVSVHRIFQKRIGRAWIFLPLKNNPIQQIYKLFKNGKFIQIESDMVSPKESFGKPRHLLDKNIGKFCSETILESVEEEVYTIPKTVYIGEYFPYYTKVWRRDIKATTPIPERKGCECMVMDDLGSLFDEEIDTFHIPHSITLGGPIYTYAAKPSVSLYKGKPFVESCSEAWWNRRDLDEFGRPNKCKIYSHRLVGQVYMRHCFECITDSLRYGDVADRVDFERRKRLFNHQFVKAETPKIEKVSQPTAFGKLWAGIANHTVCYDKLPNPQDRTVFMAQSEDENTSYHPSVQEKKEENFEIPTMETIVGKLRKKKKKSSNGKELFFGEGRFADKNVKLQEKDVFTKVVHNSTFGRTMRKLGIGSGITTQQTFPITDETVFMPTKVDNCVFSPLPQFTREQLRNLDKYDVSSTGIVAIDMAIQSHATQGDPLVAFCTIMDNEKDDPNYAPISGSKFDLGRDRCQVITLPLTNINISNAFKRIDDEAGSRLYLATLFNDRCGIRVGAPVFQYGVSQLLEHRPNAYTNKSLCKEEWADIEKRNALKGCRILKGFNVEQSIVLDYNQTIKPFSEKAVLTCRKSDNVQATHVFTGSGIVKNANVSRLSKSVSMKCLNDGVGTSTSSRFGLASGIAPHRASVDVPCVEDGRYFMAQTTEEKPYSLAIVAPLEVKKDAKEGDFVGTVNFMAMMRTQARTPYLQALNAGMIDPVIQMKIYTGSTAFVGTTIVVVHDFYNRVDVDKLGSKLYRSVGNSFPQTMRPLNQGGCSVHTIDTRKYLGHTLFVKDLAFADPRFHVYIYDDNALPMAENWQCTLEFYVKVLPRTPFEIAKESCFEVGVQNFAYIDLDIYKGVGSIALAGKPTAVTIPLHFGEPAEYATNKISFGFTQAIYRCLQGTGGYLHGQITQIGTLMISCVVRVGMWWSTSIPTLSDISNVPHCDIDLGKSDGTFKLLYQSPYSRVSSRERNILLYFFPLGGPTGPKDVSSPFTFSVYFKGIEPLGPVKQIDSIMGEFAWIDLDLSAVEKQSGPVQFPIPAYIKDVEYTVGKVTLRTNTLAYLFGSCGFFSGRTEIIVYWTQRHPLSGKRTNVHLCRMYGTDTSYEMQATEMYNSALVGRASMTSEVGDFTGFETPVGSRSNRNFYMLRIDDVEFLSNVVVCIRLLPGFKFYGRSAIICY
uniref:Polyprotein n=1 Tax=Senecio pinnatifolius nepovirus TaxID=3115776 RepID=A0AAT9J7W6_9SECO